MHVVLIAFRSAGLTADRYLEVCSELAPSFAGQPGLLATSWLTGDDEQRAVLCLFTEAGSADRFLDSALAQMVSRSAHFNDLDVRRWAVDAAATVATRPVVRLVPSPPVTV